MTFKPTAKAKEIAKINKNIQALAKRELELRTTITDADTAISSAKTVLATSTDPVAITAANASITQNTRIKTVALTDWKKVSTNLANARWVLSSLLGIPRNQLPSPIVSTTEDSSSTDVKSSISLKWQYNPPMVKAAYMNPRGLQGQDGFMPVDNPGTWDDAYKAWRYSVGSKGVIQMSKDYPYWNLTETKNGVDVAKKLTEDSTVYGFKFLYNPTTVTMSWGVGTEIDIAKFSAGKFTASPITDAAMNSSITFSIILNRALDMTVVSEQGLVTGDPYPVDISLEDAKEIYKKGTMLDLEYLFRAVNGKGSDYNSSLNGNTADRGWLNSFPVELHLGSGLRYLVRVTQVNVDHKIFNERMVPIFSTVDFICKRLPDFPVTENSRDAGARLYGGADGGRLLIT